MPFYVAFSVHKFVNSVGADAGIAAIGGLAILVLLYFAQAREMATLREQSDEASQRAHLLEGQLAQLTQAVRQPGAVVAAQGQPGAAAPPPPIPLVNPVAAATAGAAGQRAPFSSPVTATAAVAQPAIGAPVGLAAPALASATKLIPTPVAVPATPMISAARVPAPVAAAAAPGAAVATPPVATAAAARSSAAAGPPNAPPPSSGATATATAPPPPPATAAGAANGNALPPGPQGGVQPLPRVQVRPGATSAPSRPPSLPPLPRQRRGNGRRVVAAIVSALLLAGVVAVLLIVTSGSSGGPQTSSKTTLTSNATVPHTSKPAPPPFNPSTVSLAVLNGTATSGLARRVATKLSGLGYKQGAIPQTAADQTHTATIVAFMPGHQADAVQVAKSLKLSAGAVQPVDQAAKTLACPQPTTCSTTVVVTVGSDLATIQ